MLSGFANADDTKLSGGGVTDSPATLSRITRIVIGGQVVGPIPSILSYGFVAEKIGSLTIHGTAVPLQPGAKNDLAGIVIGPAVRVREV